MWVYPIIKCTDVACNLRCDYCFYRHMNQRVKPESIMSEKILNKLIRDVLEINLKRCEFLWHGGEPLLAGINFFRNAIEFQRRHNCRGAVITNSIQTNGIFIDKEMADFFKEHKFRVGISLDGPDYIHNHHRKSIDERGSFDAVMRGVKLCQAKNIPVSVVAAITAHSAQFPKEIYEFFLSLEIKEFSFNPVFDFDQNGRLCEFSIQDGKFADFMEKILSLWFEDDNPEINIRQLSEPLNRMLGGDVSSCIYSGQCSHFLDIYPNGDVKPCHSFLGESMRLGNILEMPLLEIIDSDQYRQFQKYIKHFPQECLSCQYFSICRGGCTDHRNIVIDGKRREKYIYCGSRKRIFSLLEENLVELGYFRKEEI